MASSKILNNPFVLTKNIELEGFNSTILGPSKLSVIEEVLPFRVRFTAIQVPGVSPSNVPPIPLQVIGFSNYIL
jgi:hypothetical protein